MIDELLKSLSFGRVFSAAIVIYSIVFYSRRLRVDREIRALGGHAPKVRTYLPLGIDFVYRGITATVKHRNLELWEWLFKSGNANCPYTVEVNVASERLLFTADVENIKAILTTQFADYGKGEPFHKDWRDFLGDGIFTTDGAEWHKNRQLIRPQFIKDRVSDLETFEVHVQKLIGLMGGRGEEVDVSELFFRYTLDAITDFLLGRTINSLANPQVKFAEAFAEVQRVQNIISRAGPFNWLVPRRSFFAGIKILDSFVTPYIDDALRLSPSDLEAKTKSSTGYTFLHALASFTRDRTTIRDQIVSVLLAGRDTTAAMLSWLFYELSAHPAIVRTLRAEILARLGPSTPPTYDDLKNMRYLQHVLSETLRLYPGVPFNVRLALHDTTLPHGGGPDGLQPIGIRKNTPVGYSTLLMQRRRDLYPEPSAAFPDVAVFAPERWEHWTPKSWTYIPFNGGPRICIGQQFALTEMGYTVVRILQRFERVERYWKDGEQVLKAEIVLQPGAGVRVGFWEAKGEA
ncbi:MAG: cytochrome P450 [Lasallia pustulata]|uniref:Cytochrome P450 n=1 Tax=Lasallia pustulata TaxID=136370 RepID=A0A5M8PVR6_9LECA|nr:MAG: cytochrome P450 [Lasallia pustulata]